MLDIKPILAATSLLVLLASTALADEMLSFKGGYLSLNPDGDVAVSSSDIPGTVLDLDDDLGMDDSDDFFLEAALQLGSFRLFAAYLPINFSGDSVLSENIVFSGETFVTGSRVESEVDIDIYEAGLAWFLINVDDLPVRIQVGPEVSVKYIDTYVKLRDGDLDLSESEDFGVPLPTVGVRGRLAVADFLGVVGRAGYAEYSDNSFMDVDAQIEFSPLPLVGLFAGYRYLDIDVDESDVLIDATFSGPYAGALIRF